MIPDPSTQEPFNHFEAGTGWRKKVHSVIFEADTPGGKLFDVCLLIAIVISVVIVSLETVAMFANEKAKWWFDAGEWFFTILFTIEYILRLSCLKRPLRYAFSFYGLIDLMAILPAYITLFGPDKSSLVVVRSLRLMRVFRIFKLVWFLQAADELGRAVWNARAKVVVFVSFVTITVVITGTVMYEIEGPHRETGFTSIPEGMYWAIVTMTTVGYGDIVPHTTLGKFVASTLILLGYSLIIVPAGFVSAEMVKSVMQNRGSDKICSGCQRAGHDVDATCCKYCGANLLPEKATS